MTVRPGSAFFLASAEKENEKIKSDTAALL